MLANELWWFLLPWGPGRARKNSRSRWSIESPPQAVHNERSLENVNLGSLEFNTKDNINTWGGLMPWECLSVSCTYSPILLPTSCGCCLEMAQRFYSEQHCFILDSRVLYCSPVAPSPSYPGLTGYSSEGRECYAAPGSLWSGWRYQPDE